MNPRISNCREVKSMLNAVVERDQPSRLACKLLSLKIRRGVRVVAGARLESVTAPYVTFEFTAGSLTRRSSRARPTSTATEFRMIGPAARAERTWEHYVTRRPVMWARSLRVRVPVLYLHRMFFAF